MALLFKRPLAAACLLLIFCVFIAYFTSIRTAVLLVVCIAALFLFVLTLSVRRGFEYRKIALLLLLLFAMLGFGRVTLERRAADALLADRFGERVTAEFEIFELENQGTYQTLYRVRLSELDGEKTGACMLVYAEGLLPFGVGDRVQGEFFCVETKEICYYEGQERQYLADGIYGALAVEDTATLTLTRDGNGTWRSVLLDLREVLAHRLSRFVKGDAGDLMSAILLGSREHLDEGVTLSFRRVGLSHLLAISGLHLSVLSLVFDKALFLCRVPKRVRVGLLTAFCVGYLFLTGFSYSMLRATLMMLILQGSFFTKEDYDGLTALSLCAAVLLLVSPGALFDLSFQMTMLATFGILSFGELRGRVLSRLSGKRGVWRVIAYLGRVVFSSLFISLAAFLAILPVQWLVFGEVSLLSPLSNLLMIPFVIPLLGLGVLLLLLMALPPLAPPVGLLLQCLGDAMLTCIRRLSDLDCMLSLRYAFVAAIFIPLFVLTAILLLVDLKRLKGLVLAPAALATVAFAVCLTVCSVQGASELNVIYRTTGSNDGLMLVQNGEAMICDLSNGSYTQLSSDYRLLQEECATDVEVLMLTHYHTRHPRAILRFAKRVKLREILLPTPRSEDDRLIAAEIEAVAARVGASVRYFEHETMLSFFGEGRVTLSEPLYEKRSVEPALALDVAFGEDTLSYQSDAYSEYVRHAGLSTNVATEHLILGGHGPVPHEEIAPQLSGEPIDVLLSDEKAAKWLSAEFSERVFTQSERKYILCK